MAKRLYITEEQFKSLIGDNSETELVPDEEIAVPDVEEPEMQEPEPVIENIPTYQDVADEAKDYIERANFSYWNTGEANIADIIKICKIIKGKDKISLEGTKPSDRGKYGKIFQACFGLPINDNKPEADFDGWELKTSTNSETGLFSQVFNANAFSKGSPIIPSESIVSVLKKSPSKSFIFTMNNLKEINYRFGENKAIDDKVRKDIQYIPVMKRLGNDILIIFNQTINGKPTNEPAFSIRIKTSAIADIAWKKLKSAIFAKSKHDAIDNKEDYVNYSKITLWQSIDEERYKKTFINIFSQRTSLKQLGITLTGKLSFNTKSNAVSLATTFSIQNTILPRLYKKAIMI